MGILPHRYTCASPLVFLETTDTLLNKQITTTSLLPGWKFVLAFSYNLSSVPEISNETLNQAFQTTIFLMSSTQISDSIFTSNAAFAKTFRNFWKELHREGNDWAYMAIALWFSDGQTYVCISPVFWEIPAVLLIKASRGSSCAQAVGTLPGWKSAALVQLSVREASALQRHNKKPS